MNASANYLRVRDEWLLAHREPILEPEVPIVDAHHHFYDRPGWRYLEEDYRADAGSGHAVRASVYMQALTRYPTFGPDACKPVGETEYVVDATGADASPAIAAGIVGHADLRLGTNMHLGGELFKSAAGVDIVHVPYKGAGAVLQDLMGGQVQALVTSLPTALPHIKSGKLRALMVTSEKRSPLLPDVPSAKEAGLPKVVMDFWVGFAVPAGTPQPVVDKLNRAFADALNSPEGRKQLAEQGLEPATNSPAQAAEFVAGETQRWGAVVKAAGIKAD
jgi:hypothetical protein